MRGKECKLRRNDVVFERGADWIMYGRVWRRIDATHVQVIDSGRMVRIYKDEDLALSDYKGYWKLGRELSEGKRPVFVRMPSLRWLKKDAAKYNAHFGGRNSWGRRWTNEERKADLEDREVHIPVGQRA